MYTHAQRTSSDYIPNPDDIAIQNPLMRLYNLANRDRDEIKLRFDLTPGASFEIGLDGHAYNRDACLSRIDTRHTECVQLVNNIAQGRQDCEDHARESDKMCLDELRDCRAGC